MKHHPHTKVFYVGGSISLILLPVMFLISTIQEGNNAIRYGTTEIDLPRDDFIDYIRQPTVLSYQFPAIAESLQISDFRNICQALDPPKRRSYDCLLISLPNKCSYGFFINVLKVLDSANINYYKFFDRKILTAITPPGRLSALKGRMYQAKHIDNRLWGWLKSIPDQFMNLFPARHFDIHRMIYSNLGPPETNLELADEPPFPYPQLGLWTIPIGLAWLILCFFSIRKALTIALPANQSLKLTEPAVDDLTRAK